MAAAPRTRVRRVVWVVAIAVVLVIAGGVGTYLLLAHPSEGSPTVVNDGPTFYQVLSSANESVTNTTGGPWSLVSVIGIASPIPFSPNVAGYLRLNVTVNSCQQQFQGLTLWNGSLPTFAGTFNSGTAPFWQLGYYSQVTQQVLIATDTSGVSRVYAPMSITNNCTYAWTTFRYDPGSWVNQIYANGSLPVDSSTAAGVAWANLDRGWIGQNSPLAEVYALGPGMMTGTGDVTGGSWEVYFMGCGLEGNAGIRPIYAAGVSREGAWEGALNGTRNCVTLNSSGPVIDRGLNKFSFYSPTTVSGAGTTWIETPYQVEVTELNGSFYGYYDGWGVANWMTKFNVTNSSGKPLPLGSPRCDSWVPAVSDCVADPSGWYAVVLSAGGQWVNSFGLQLNGTVGWAAPVTAFVSHQQLVIVAPASWTVAEETLTVASTVSVAAITGSLTL